MSAVGAGADSTLPRPLRADHPWTQGHHRVARRGRASSLLEVLSRGADLAVAHAAFEAAVAKYPDKRIFARMSAVGAVHKWSIFSCRPLRRCDSAFVIRKGAPCFVFHFYSLRACFVA